MMDEYIELPEETRAPFVETLVDVVSNLRQAISHHSEELNQELDTWLKEYYASPYSYKLGGEALPGADEEAAAAVIYAAEAYCTGDAEAAICAAMGLLGEAEARASVIAGANGEPWNARESKARTVRLQQIEIDRLKSAVSLLETEGLTGTLPRLWQIFADEPEKIVRL